MNRPVKGLLVCALFAALTVNPVLRGADCNGNGVDDLEDLAPRSLGFFSPPILDLPRNAQSVSAADLNGDSHQDLLVADGKGDVSILLNSGTGDFGAGDHYTVTDGDTRPQPAIDLDGDEDLDLAFGSVMGVSVMLNRGNGTFDEQVRYATGQPLPWSARAAELNGDERPDFLPNRKL